MIKNYSLIFLLFFTGLFGQFQNFETSENNKHINDNYEKILWNFPNFSCDTNSLKKYLQPLKNNTKPSAQIIYNILAAEGIANCEDRITEHSNNLFKKAIKQAEKTNPELEVVANIYYAKYLYRYRKMEKALPFFLKAYHLLEKHPNKKHIRPEESYKWIGYYFGTIGDIESSVKSLEKAKSLSKNQEADYASILDALGLYYFNNGNVIKAEDYFNQVESISKSINDKLRYAKALGNLSLIHRKRGETENAKKLLMKDITISEQLQENQNTMYAYTLLGEFLIQEKKYSEAHEALQKALQIAESKSYFQANEIKIQQLLTSVYKNLNNKDGELQSYKRINELEKELKKTDGDLALNNANLLMQKSKLEQANNEAHYQKEKSALMRKVYIIITLLTFILIGFIYAHSRKKLRNRELIYKQKVMGLEMDKLKFEQKISETQQNLDAQVEFLKNKNIQIHILKSEIEKIKNSNSYYLEEQQGELHTLLQSHLMTDENWENFKREFIKVYPKFYKKIQSEYPDLTDSNYRIILLKKLDFNNVEISELLGITIDAVKKSNQRMKKKLGDRYDELSKIINRS